MDEKAFYPATVMPDSDWWQALWPDPVGVLARLGITPDDRVVDLCCGEGLFTLPLCQNLCQSQTGGVVAVDLDPEMLARARQAIAQAGAPSPEWIEGDADRMAELVGDKADVVLIANTFHGVPDQTGLARAAAAILRPGGRFVVVNWHRRPREETPVLGQPRGPRFALRMTPQDVVRMVEPAGFELSELVEIPPYHYGAVFVKSAGGSAPLPAR